MLYSARYRQDEVMKGIHYRMNKLFWDFAIAVPYKTGLNSLEIPTTIQHHSMSRLGSVLKLSKDLKPSYGTLPLPNGESAVERTSGTLNRK